MDDNTQTAPGTVQPVVTPTPAPVADAVPTEPVSSDTPVSTEVPTTEIPTSETLAPVEETTVPQVTQ